MSSSSSSRGPLLPALVGLVALVAALTLGYLTVRDTSGPDTAVEQVSSADPVPTRRLVSKQGRYAVAAPHGLEVERIGGTIRLTSAEKDLAIVVGPAGPGRLAQAEKRLLAQVREEYRRVVVLGKEPMRVDGRPARTAFGHAVNAAGVKIRFALVTVHARGRNHSIASYAAYDSDPSFVLPQVNAVANGFEVLGRG